MDGGRSSATPTVVARHRPGRAPASRYDPQALAVLYPRYNGILITAPAVATAKASSPSMLMPPGR